MRAPPKVPCLLWLLLPCLPGPAWGQAEQAPPDFVPSAASPAEQDPSAPPAPQQDLPPPPRPRPPPPSWPRVRIIADVRLSGLLGETRRVAPNLGWGFGLKLSASLLRLGPVQLGFVLDYEQDRFSRTYAEAPDQAQLLVHNTFALMPQVDLRSRWLRPFLAAGAGASQARHQSPLRDSQSGNFVADDNALVPLFRIAAGLGFSPLRWLEIGLCADVSLTLSSLKGGVEEMNGVLSPGTATLFAPGWWSAAFYGSYNFY